MRYIPNSREMAVSVLEKIRKGASLCGTVLQLKRGDGWMLVVAVDAG
jgi:hypothetical protein